MSVQSPISGDHRLRLLALGIDAFWKPWIERALANGDPTVEFASTRLEAVSRLISTTAPFSHVLLQAPCAAIDVAQFLSLTSGDAGLGTQLLMLGEPGLLPPDSSPTQGICINVSSDQALELGHILHLPQPRLAPDALAGLGGRELLSLIASDALEIRYQPMVELSSRQPVAYEALARLCHPMHGMLSGEQFVPLAEAAGLSPVLTQAIGGRMMRDMAAIRHDDGLITGINFSLDVMLIDGTLDILEEQREAAGVRVDRVMIELTESRPAEDFRALARALDRLRQAGYGVALDDLGPAVPRLMELLDLPFTAAKLDKSVVHPSAEGPATDYLPRLVDACKSRGLLVIAEGAERQGDLSRLAAVGADWAQGYVVARPLPASALPIWRQAWEVGKPYPG